MTVLGLTGNLASGKSTVLRMLKDKGAEVFDVDERIHRYYLKESGDICKKVTASFPEALEGGQISRKKLADIVFPDKRKLKVLEEIVHPVVVEDLLLWIAEAKRKKGIYAAEVPLLFEKKLARHFDAVALVVVRKDVLIERIVRKYNLSRAEVVNRLSLYIPVKEKIKQADFIIRNSLDLEKLKREVDLLWEKIV